MSTEPDLLERTRMVLADTGIDPSKVDWHPEAPGELLNVSGRCEDFKLLWRAEQIATFHDPRHVIHCLACATARQFDPRTARIVFERCEAHLPLTEDCGVDR